MTVAPTAKPPVHIEQQKKRKREDDFVEEIEETPVPPTYEIPKNTNRHTKSLELDEESFSDEDEEDDAPLPDTTTKRISKKKSEPTERDKIWQYLLATLPTTSWGIARDVAIKGLWGLLFVLFVATKNVLYSNYQARIQQPNGFRGNDDSATTLSPHPPPPPVRSANNPTNFSAFK